MIRSVAILILSVTLVHCHSNKSNPNLLDSFQIEEGFKIELIASEPLISDPVDMEIDEQGRWYVVEMHGYPLDLSGSGKVKRLIDTNGDGLPDKSTIFIDSLVLPTGIMRWKKGFLITDPPNVLYFEDTNNDGKADHKEIVLTGFARSNPQHNVNNPIYGIDNWIYLSHEGAVGSIGFKDVFGDRGSDVHFPKLPNSDRLAQNANGLGVRFKPKEGLLETLSARGQFGHTFDSWGHHFLTSNADHLFHEVIDASYIRRNANLRIPSGRVYLPKSGRGFEIYPITENPDHQLFTDIGMITSACGITWYQGGIFPEEYNNTVFTAEPVHNIVHVDKILDKGATFESINLLKNREFLASKDSWFRPVNHYIGPDGALYILDYHRKVIEHPEWLSDEVINSGDLYKGIEKGRIYRITPKDFPALDFIDKINLNSNNISELIELLNHSNIWWRTHAQRLLMDSTDPKITTEIVKSLSTNFNEIGKIHAMWVLQGKNALNTELILTLLEDISPNVREQAIKLAEPNLSESGDLIRKLLSMENDSSDKVRYQLLLTLGGINSKESEIIRTEMLLRDIENEWMQNAALTSNYLNLQKLFNRSKVEFAQKEATSTTLFFQRISRMLVREKDANSLNTLLKSILTSTTQEWYKPIILESILIELSNDKIAVNYENIRLLESKFSEDANPEIRTLSIDILNKTGYFKSKKNNLISKAKAVLEINKYDGNLLKDAVRIIARTDADKHLELFSMLLQDNSNTNVRLSAVEAFGYTNETNSLKKLVALWPNLLPAERDKGIWTFFRNDESCMLLIKSIQTNEINKASLSWPSKVQLLNSHNLELRELSRSVLNGNELSADSVWNEYRLSLSMNGVAKNGENIFKKACGLCHQKSGENGSAFGPDLASVQNRSKSALLLDILQPNRSIADGYELWQIEMKSGNSLIGIITNDSPTSITVIMNGGQEQTVNRTEIKSLLAFEYSAMPENLNSQISLKDMADLLAYLKE